MLGKVRQVGPYSRPDTLRKLDRRTKEARYLEAVIADLTAHVGGEPSVTQRALIQRAAWLSLRCVLLDEKMRGERFTVHDNNFALSWNNALVRTLARLGLESAAKQPPQTLAEALAAGRAAQEGDAA